MNIGLIQSNVDRVIATSTHYSKAEVVIRDGKVTTLMRPRELNYDEDMARMKESKAEKLARLEAELAELKRITAEIDNLITTKE